MTRHPDPFSVGGNSSAVVNSGERWVLGVTVGVEKCPWKEEENGEAFHRIELLVGGTRKEIEVGKDLWEGHNEE